jgi:hypothetical protein
MVLPLVAFVGSGHFVDVVVVARICCHDRSIALSLSHSTSRGG